MRIYSLLPAKQAAVVADQITKVRDWKQGKARTEGETGTIKQNEEILKHPLLPELGRKIISHPGIALDCIPLKCHQPKFSRYQEGARYQAHTDAPWMGETRTDLSCTLWLSDPESYEGGELVIGGQAFKGEPGQAFVYDCGEAHEVRPVSQGQRIAVITWIQSRIRDPIKRQFISDYRRFLEKLEDHPELFLEGGRFNSALLRRWSE